MLSIYALKSAEVVTFNSLFEMHAIRLLLVHFKDNNHAFNSLFEMQGENRRGVAVNDVSHGLSILYLRCMHLRLCQTDSRI